MTKLEAMPLTPRRPRLGDQAYDLLKRDIIVCRLRPGSEITEASLAKHYNLGLAPVRTALSRLCQDGLLVVVPRRGYIVAPVTTQGVQEIFDLRLLLEPAAARAATGRVDVALLRDLSGGPYSGVDVDEDLRFLQDNRDFHVEIARASGNDRLARILTMLLDEMDRLLHLGLFAPRDADAMRIDHAAQREQHEALIEALAAGDENQAEQVARQHVEHSRELVLKAVISGRLSLNL